MQLDKKMLAFLQNIVKTAQLIKLDAVIIEAGDTDAKLPVKIRAMDENKTVVMFHEHAMDLPYAIGLNRLNTFVERYELVKTSDNFVVEAETTTDNDGRSFVRGLTMKGKGIKVEYRCANPATITAPKVLNDSVKYKIKMTPEAVLTMQKGQTAMDAELVTFTSDKDGISFQIEDVNKDGLNYIFGDHVEPVGSGTNTDFTYKYSLKTIIPLFKQVSDGYFHITTKGMLKLTVNGLDLYIIPRI